MKYPATPEPFPNLPVGQRLTQWFVDQFNDDEAKWRLAHKPIAALLERTRKRKNGQCPTRNDQ